jgi:hypothetical protein
VESVAPVKAEMPVEAQADTETATRAPIGLGG